MAISAETRTHLIGLSVAMLGQAPGTKRLNEWVGDLNDEENPMTVAELAGHIAETEAFTTAYPIFQTPGEFADKLLGVLLPGVSPVAMMAAKDLVVSQLNDDVGRGEIIHNVVVALLDVAEAGASHPLWIAYGEAATAFHNKVLVAEHYTVKKTMAEPSASVLDGVDHTDGSRQEAIDRIDLVRQDVRGDDETDVEIGSADGTSIVEVTGGKSVTIGLEADGKGQSQSVETVRVFEIERDVAGTEKETNFSHFNLRTDFDDFVLAPDGNRVEIPIAGLQQKDGGPIVGDGGNTQIKVARAEGTKLTDEIPVRDGSGEAIENNNDYPLHYNPVTGKFKWGPYAGTLTGQNIPAPPTEASLPGTVNADGDGVSMDRERVETTMDVPVPGGDPTVTIRSDAIARVELHDTDAVALIVNESKMADGKDKPEDLLLAVNNYGDDSQGKVCIKGQGSAENIDILVVDDSNFRLASNEVKTLDIDAGGSLVLAVTTFDDEDADPVYKASGTLESITVEGDGKVTMAGLAGMDSLEMIDASMATGMVHFRSGKVGAFESLKALETVMTGSGGDIVEVGSTADGKLAAIHTHGGNDRVTVMGEHRTKDGLEVLLGDGDDHYHGTNAKANKMSVIDGGDGMDTLRLTNGAGATYTEGTGKAQKTLSIYKNFEILDAGGGQGKYDITALGVEGIRFSASTADEVELSNVVSEGMGFHVMSGKAGTDAAVEVDYKVAAPDKDPEFREENAGSTINRDFTVNLTAAGGSKDKDDSKGKMDGVHTGQASATITVQAGIDAMIVNSMAKAGGKATAAGYTNTVIIAESGLVRVKLNGDSMVNLQGKGLEDLRLVDAKANKAGVVVDVGAGNDATAADKLTMRGSDGADMLHGGNGVDVLMGNKGDDTLEGRDGADTLHGGDGMDTIMGGAGDDVIRGGAHGDTLTGGEGNDMFEFTAQSDSQLSGYDKTGAGMGMDTIMGFLSGTDKIVLSEDLYDKVRGAIRGTGNWANWKSVDLDGDPQTPGTIDITEIDGTPTEFKKAVPAQGTTPAMSAVPPDSGAMNLKEFIGDGKGLFESRGADTSGVASVGGNLTKYSIALISQDLDGTDNDGLWVLFDVDGDGDFEQANDMVIFLQGATGFLGTDIMEAS